MQLCFLCTSVFQNPFQNAFLNVFPISSHERFLFLHRCKKPETNEQKPVVILT